jgi:hypothetical protein
MPTISGCATSGGPDPEAPAEATSTPDDRAQAPPEGEPDAADEPRRDAPRGIDLGGRAQSALEGMVLGAVIGAQAGPIGAAVGAGTLLLYAAATGHVPLSGGAPSSPRDSRDDEEIREEELEEELDRELGRELERSDALEQQIEAELERQEKLLDEMAAEREAGTSPPETPSDGRDLASRADPRSAPAAPEDRVLPLAIFDKEERSIGEGEWGNDSELLVIARTLDADEDGHPEQVRYFDAQPGAFLRKEQDRDYDGRLDSWSSYEDGALVRRELDENGDGTPDAFEEYADGLMTSREVDRNHDGTRDAFYTYQGDSLTLQRHDSDDDGQIDLVVRFEDRRRVRLDEDRDRDGRFDQWTQYGVAGDEEVVTRVERDSSGDGNPDVFESYEAVEGETLLAKREEDKDGDGRIDITSIYRNGKLVRREISDPDLVPL